MIKYLGSKRVLLPQILSAVDSVFARWEQPSKRGRGRGAKAGVGIGGVRGTVLDLFSGTSRVGHALKGEGYRVIANDHNAYAQVLARCYVGADDDRADEARQRIDELNAMRGVPGYMTETFCVKSRYFHPKNGERIDAMREAIARWRASGDVDQELEAVLLVALMEASDRVDSTTGVQMAYLKSYSHRAGNDVTLRLPKLLPRPAAGKCAALGMDAITAAEVDADVTYIDPPYNQHSYLGNYHVWESLVRWDKPEVYGIACKRVDVRTRQSAFNRRSAFANAFGKLLGRVRSRAAVISFSNEGYITGEELEEMISAKWGAHTRIERVEVDYPRYIGAKIGIYNLKGKKVGKVSHVRNKENLYVVERG